MMTMINMNVPYDDDDQWLSYIAVTDVDDDDDDQYCINNVLCNGEFNGITLGSGNM